MLIVPKLLPRQLRSRKFAFSPPSASLFDFGYMSPHLRVVPDINMADLQFSLTVGDGQLCPSLAGTLWRGMAKQVSLLPLPSQWPKNFQMNNQN